MAVSEGIEKIAKKAAIELKGAAIKYGVIEVFNNETGDKIEANKAAEEYKTEANQELDGIKETIKQEKAEILGHDYHSIKRHEDIQITHNRRLPPVKFASITPKRPKLRR